MLAYLPQHIAEATTVSTAVAIGIRALIALVTGRLGSLPQQDQSGNWTANRVRGVAVGLLLIAGGLASSGFLVHAEPPGGSPNHWGTTGDRIAFGAWLTFLVTISAYSLWRDKQQ
jgi:hypothetical protein